MNEGGGIWIQGAGELASGVAVRLVRSGYRVALAEVSNPLAVRRLVSFSEAVYEGRVEVEGIPGILVEGDCLELEVNQVAIVVDPLGELLPHPGIQAIVDARMTKKPPVALNAGTLPVIGLGPGFTCGEDADLVIETHREARLGSVICRGSAAPNTGIPGVLGGESSMRVLRAPAAGHLSSLFKIGDLVEEGQVLGHVGGLPVVSALTGQIRGLVHPEAELNAGTKVGDVDPRGSAINPKLVSDKSLAVGGGVLEALLRLQVLPAGF